MNKILGISAFYHDAAAVLLVDGKIAAAAQEERFSRKKHDAAFPVNAIRYCLEEGGYAIDELDAVVFYEKPLLKFERLLQTYYAFAPFGLQSFLKSMPQWMKEKLFLKKYIYDGLREVEDYDHQQLKLLFSEHHLSHASSAFFASPFGKSAILTIDGVGEWCTASISIGEGHSIRFLKEMEFPHSVGLLYSAFTYYLGFKVNGGEYKLMGLAPYGNTEVEQTHNFISVIKSQLVDIKSDGSIWLNSKFFNYATGLTMTHDRRWEKCFGLKRRKPEAPILPMHCNLALAIQQVTEEIILKMAREVKRITGMENLCLAGGVALNCVANGKLLQAKIFNRLFIQPASGDAGGALGAALAIHHLYFQNKRHSDEQQDLMQGTYLGPSFSEKEIEKMNRRERVPFKKYEDFALLCADIATYISQAKVIGWFQGRMEFGPRALGNRSILGDARHPDMQLRINSKIKFRESFRPFAPSVLREDVNAYFQLSEASPYMLLTAQVQSDRRKPLPSDYHEQSMMEKLQNPRSDLPAITHLDYSARVQTVSKNSNPRYFQLLSAFKSLTDCSVILNTSFNTRGEPIVCTPRDAFNCFQKTEMDVLVLNNFVYLRKN